MKRWWVRIVVVLLASINASAALAQTNIMPDATLPTNTTVSNPGAGSIYNIDDGTVVGSNQFHSFSQFDLGFNDTANFNGPAGTQNILSRVTGTDQSDINGTMQSSMPGVNLWFINPNGVVFGAEAAVDIPGSFHVSTADYLQEPTSGGVFYANPAQTSVLFVAEPTTFGFVSGTSASIVLDRDTGFVSGNTLLEVQEGQAISIVAGDVTIDQYTLQAPAGRINLVSVGSSTGTVTLQPDGIDMSPGVSGGAVSFAVGSQKSELDVSGVDAGGGSVFIRGGRFTADTGDISFPNKISANTTGTNDGGVIDIRVDGVVTYRGVIEANTSGAGDGGQIYISGSDISFLGGGINSDSILEAKSEFSSAPSGNAGDISLVATNEINLTAQINVSTDNSGDAGNILLTSGANTNINGNGQITSSTSGSGKGGNISIIAQGDVAIGFNGGNGRLAADTSGDGDAGSISITAQNIRNSQELDISTNTTGTNASGTNGANAGAGGDILLDVRSNNANGSILLQGGSVKASTSSAGDGGSITLRAGNINLSDTSSLDPFSMEAVATGVGNAGDIVMDAGDIDINSGARVLASTSAAGAAGSIDISASNNFILQDASAISSKSLNSSSGAAGSIDIAADTLRINDQGSVSVETASNDVANTAGTITLTGGQAIVIDNDPYPRSDVSVSAKTTGAGSPGGSIVLDAPTVTLTNTTIEATTEGSGTGGSVTLNGTNLSIDNATVSAATSGVGAGGDVVVNAVNADVINTGQINVTTSANGIGGTATFNATNLTVDGPGSKVTGATSGNGQGGSVEVNGGTVTLINQGVITVSTDAAGTGGTATFNATDISVDGSGSKVSGETAGVGQGGSLVVNDSSILLTNDGALSVATNASGAGGSITISNTALNVDGGIVSAETFSSNTSGIGGDIAVTGGTARVQNNGRIVADTSGAAMGGNINISADSFTVGSGGQVAANSLASSTANGGSVTIGGPALLIDGGQVSSTTAGVGSGGAIVITAEEVEITGGGEVLASSSGAGTGGTINIDAPQFITMNNGAIRSEASQPNTTGGDVTVVANDYIYLLSSEISTSASNTGGNAGNIRIGENTRPENPSFLIMQDNIIRANAGAAGGAINIYAEYVLGSQNIIEAISDTGNDGEINFDTPVSDFANVVTQMDVPYLDLRALLNNRCALSALQNRSSFIVDAGGLPPSPDDYQSSSYTGSLSTPVAAQTVRIVTDKDLAAPLYSRVDGC